MLSCTPIARHTTGGFAPVQTGDLTAFNGQRVVAFALSTKFKRQAQAKRLDKTRNKTRRNGESPLQERPFIL